MGKVFTESEDSKPDVVYNMIEALTRVNADELNQTQSQFTLDFA